jgi:glycerol-3-phosphate acyltransferase PlsY
VALGLIAGLLLWRHKANIGRLINDTEPKIGAKS